MKNRLQHFLPMILLGGIMLMAVACKKDDVPASDQALVTTLRLALTAMDKGPQDVVVEFSDAAGVGGKKAPGPVTLKANTSYSGTLLLLDGSKNPEQDVTADYEVTFHAVNANVTFSRDGQEILVQTTAPISGTASELHVSLTKGGKTQQVTFPLAVNE